MFCDNAVMQNKAFLGLLVFSHPVRTVVMWFIRYTQYVRKCTCYSVYGIVTFQGADCMGYLSSTYILAPYTPVFIIYDTDILVLGLHCLP